MTSLSYVNCLSYSFFFLSCIFVGRQFLECQNYSFGLGQYHVSDISSGTINEGQTFRKTKPLFITTAGSRITLVKICKGFYIFIFTLACTIFLFLIQDVNSASSVVEISSFRTLCWLWTLKALCFSVTYVFPFLVVFCWIVNKSPAKIISIKPGLHNYFAIYEIFRILFGVLLSFLSMGLVQLLMWLNHEENVKMNLNDFSFLSRTTIQTAQQILSFGMSEEGFRSSLAQIAVPGVAISAFVTAYATVSLSYPVAASLLSLWNYYYCCCSFRLFARSRLPSPCGGADSKDLSLVEWESLLRQLTRDIVSKKRQLLMISRQSHHLHHSPYSTTINRRRYCLEGQSPAQSRSPSPILPLPLSGLSRQDSCSNLTRGLGGLGELGEGLPLQQQQQSPPYCPLKDTSADNIARMSLAALTLKEEVQQLESWSRRLFLDMLTASKASSSSVDTDSPLRSVPSSSLGSSPCSSPSPSSIAALAGRGYLWLRRTSLLLVCLLGMVRLGLAALRLLSRSGALPSFLAESPSVDFVTATYRLWTVALRGIPKVIIRPFISE